MARNAGRTRHGHALRPAPANGLISHVGPLTRTVADAALMLQAMAGPDDREYDQPRLRAG